jgi:hypothetical protein
MIKNEKNSEMLLAVTLIPRECDASEYANQDVEAYPHDQCQTLPVTGRFLSIGTYDKFGIVNI